MNIRNIVLPTKKEVDYLVGNPTEFNTHKVYAPFNDIILELFSELSRSILSNSDAKRYPDVITFGYWCRTSNLNKMKSAYTNLSNRKGLGTVFHIAPSNVPVNFAFSLAFSLLSGNVSIVRVPSKDFEQVSIIARLINALLSEEKYTELRRNIYLVRYAQNDAITTTFSSVCNARIVWGSDDTVQKVKSIKLPSRSIDIPFSERYSMAVLGAEEIVNANETQLKRLVEGFYNDTYLMDQNACSSPQLVYWYANDINLLQKAKDIFWSALKQKVESDYDLAAKSSVDKLTWMCLDLVDREYVSKVNTDSNFIYRLEIESIPENVNELKGKYGYFYERTISNLNDINIGIDNSVQTLTYFGIDKNNLFDVVYNSNNLGIDRIVPVGSALEIGIIWDGYDMIYTLTRIIDLK